MLTQKYYNPFNGTEVDYKPATNKEILCYFQIKSTGGVSNNCDFRIWANTTKDSKSGGRDVFGVDFRASVSTGFLGLPPFILKSNEYLNVERITGSGDVVVTKIVSVERDAT